jgi:hypothetical protein
VEDDYDRSNALTITVSLRQACVTVAAPGR